MKFLKSLLEFYINSSVHVAIAVCCLSWITLIEFGFEPDSILLLFTFFATITGYNFVKYFGLAKFHHRRLANWLKYIQIFSFISFIALCYYAMKLPIRTLWYLGGLSVITFLYAIPFLPKRYFLDQAQNLRAISGLKIYIIAFVWAITTVLIPIVNQDAPIAFDVIISSFQRFIYVLVVMLPFEIRDMQFDSLKLSTIPQKIGVKQSKAIGVVLMIAFFLMEYFKDDFSTKKVIVTLIIAVVVSGLVLLSQERQSKYYSSFWVEAIPILWLVLWLI